jgi:hypothetical protein
MEISDYLLKLEGSLKNKQKFSMKITKNYQIDVRRGRSDIENGEEGIPAVHLDVAEDVQSRDE